MKRLVHYTAGRAAVALQPFSIRADSPCACILMYHRVADIGFSDPEHDDWNVCPETFERHIAALVEVADVVQLSKLPGCLGKPGNRPVVAVTFDDGFATFFTEALRILQNYDVPSTVFVVTQEVETGGPMSFDGWSVKNFGRVQSDICRSMNWSELESCLDTGLVEIGSHSHRHLKGFQCTREQLYEETHRSRDILRSRLGNRHSKIYAYPYGSARLGFVNAAYKHAVKAAGYEIAVCSEIGLVTSDNDVHQLPRVEVHGSDTAGTVRAKTRGVLAPFRLIKRFRSTSNSIERSDFGAADTVVPQRRPDRPVHRRKISERKILVIGATGQLGKHLVPRLVERYDAVTCFVRPTTDRTPVTLPGVTFLEGDARDRESLQDAFRDTDMLISAVVLEDFAETLVPAWKAAKIPRSIFVSSTTVLTKLETDTKRRKIAAEQELFNSELNCTVVRPTMIYGTPSDQNMAKLLRYLRRWPIMFIPGDGKSLWQPIHVEDVVSALVHCVDNETTSDHNVYNISGPHALTADQIINEACKALGVRRMRVHLPLSACVWTVRLFGKLIGPHVVQVEQLLKLAEDRSVEHTAASQDFGFSPRPFSEGIRQEVALIRAEAKGSGRNSQIPITETTK